MDNPTRWIDYVPLDDIRFAPRNPKGHDITGIGGSIDLHGMGELPLVDERTGQLVAGHGRIEALRARHAQGGNPPDGLGVRDDGMWLAPVIRGWRSASDAAAESYLIGSNQWTVAGGWDDPDELAAMLRTLQATDDDLFAATGYDNASLAELAAALADPGAGGGGGVPRAEFTAKPPAPGAGSVTVHIGDCLDVLRSLPDESIDCVVTDPPYGLSDLEPDQVVTALTAWAGGNRDHVPDGKGFMGRSWDSFVPPPAVWDECLRVLKPGGHLVAFAGSRTYDLMGLSVRLAGFEIRDGLQWLYGSGFPKSLDVSKAIDKAAGAEREVVGDKLDRPGYHLHGHDGGAAFGHGIASTTSETRLRAAQITAAATDEARQWQGWGTALKPAHEPIVLARKPLGGTVAAAVLQHGTGAINIDACRVPANDKAKFPTGHGKSGSIYSQDAYTKAWTTGEDRDPSGRWPSNVGLSHAPGCGPDEQPGPCVDGCPVADLDQQSGTLKSGYMRPEVDRATRQGATYGEFSARTATATYGDQGGASRFFPTFRYTAKAATAERPRVEGDDGKDIAHPTVKPLEAMAWLVRLVTPPGGVVLDPFAGSGTTLQAARDEGFDAIGVERDPDHGRLIAARLGAEGVTFPGFDDPDTTEDDAE